MAEITPQIENAQNELIKSIPNFTYNNVELLQLTPGLFMDITREGFEELKSNPYIKNINLVTKMYAVEEENRKIDSFDPLLILLILIFIILVFLLMTRLIKNKTKKKKRKKRC